MVGKVLVGAVVAALVVGVGAPRAGADPIYTLQNCFSQNGGSGCTAEGAFVNAGLNAAVPAPDGAFVYALGRSNGVVELFSRDPHLGTLTKVQTLSPLAGATTPTDMVFGPGGTFAYFSNTQAKVGVLARDPSGGGLQPTPGPATTTGIEAAPSSTIAISPGAAAKNVYVATYNANLQAFGGAGGGPPDTLVTFSRASDGSLTWLQCLSAANNDPVGCTGAGIKGGTRQMAMTPDGQYLYTTASAVTADGTINAIREFKRNADGTLDTASSVCYGNVSPCLAGDPNVVAPTAILIPPDGSQNELYVGGQTGIDVYTYAANGTLSHLQCVNGDGSHGCVQAAGLGGPNAQPPGHIALSPDGTDLAVPVTNGVVFLKRDPTTGLLSQPAGGAGCITSDGSGGACRTFAEFAGPQGVPGGVRAAPDASQFYLGLGKTNVIAGLRADNPPVCVGANVATAFQAAVGVPVNCSDPDGEPVDVQLLNPPAHGVVSALSTAGAAYNPFAGFSGADSFSFQATSHTLISAPATDTVTIGAPPPPPPPPTPRITSPVTALWLFSTTTKVTKLTVNSIPRGATVKVTCKAKKHAKHKGGCPLTSKSFKEPSGKSSLSLLKYFKHAKLQPGTELTVAITAPGAIGKEVVYTIRLRRVPKATVLCFPVGKSKAQKKC